jgi:SAM-dependent methyltransferase
MQLIQHPEQDPMGEAVKAYWLGDRHATIRVWSDRALTDVMPAAYLFRDGAEGFSPLEQIAMDRCKGRIADLGAGAGAHSLALQRAGKQVCAFDVSPGAVWVMRERGIRHCLHADFFDSTLSGYDTWLMMMNGMGAVGSFEGLWRFLEKAAAELPPGGQVIFDSSDLRYLYEESGQALPGPGQPYYGLVCFRMTYGSSMSEYFEWLYIDFDRMQAAAADAGFDCERIADGNHYDYLAILRRKSD